MLGTLGNIDGLDVLMVPWESEPWEERVTLCRVFNGSLSRPAPRAPPPLSSHTRAQTLTHPAPAGILLLPGPLRISSCLPAPPRKSGCAPRQVPAWAALKRFKNKSDNSVMGSGRAVACQGGAWGGLPTVTLAARGDGGAGYPSAASCTLQSPKIRVLAPPYR